MRTNDISDHLSKALAVDYVHTPTHRDELLRALQTQYRQQPALSRSKRKRISILPGFLQIPQGVQLMNTPKKYARMTATFIVAAGVISTVGYGMMTSPKAHAQSLLNSSVKQLDSMSEADRNAISVKFGDGQSLTDMLNTARSDKDLREISRTDYDALIESKKLVGLNGEGRSKDGGYEAFGFASGSGAGSSSADATGDSTTRNPESGTGIVAESRAAVAGDTIPAIDAPSISSAGDVDWDKVAKDKLSKFANNCTKFVAYEDDSNQTIVIGLDSASLPVFKATLN